MVFGGDWSPEFLADPNAQGYATSLKTLRDKVNVEDRRCTQRVFKGLQSAAARAGHLSQLERPNYDFMQYIAERTAGFERTFPPTAYRG